MHEIVLPKMGQSVEEAEIVEWFKAEGDDVKEGEPLFSIQTDKAEVECESTAGGVLRKILVPTGVEVPVLTPVALVGEADEALPDLSGYDAGAAVTEAPAAESTATETPSAPVAPASQSGAAAAAPVAAQVSDAPVSPRARKTAAARGIDPATVQGSGVGGRVMEADVLAATSQKVTPTAKRMAQNAGLDLREVSGTGVGGKITKTDVSGYRAASESAPVASKASGATPVSPMRRIIAERMGASKFSAPHYYVTVEVDMSACKAFRSGLRGFKASYNDLVLFAATRALRDFPAVNARWLGDAIEEVADINLGMAVALPTGLIVPVVRQAQNLSLEGLCAATKVMAEKAKTGKLLPDDYTGNTFTVSNLGAFGVDHFTAIINQPDSAILAVGQMKDRPVVIDGGLHIRPIMKLTLSSDHRVIDGAVAAQFMGRLKEIMESASF